jgi:ABC-type nitrate/sulfonate/bicarbonate transport system substrate-binding protein
LIYVNSGILASQVVASGTAGAAAITATDALRVMSAGVPMKIIMVNIDQFQHLFVARPGIKNPGDMKGKKVAVSRYGSFSDIQRRFLIRPQSINRAIKRVVAICESTLTDLDPFSIPEILFL